MVRRTTSIGITFVTAALLASLAALAWAAAGAKPAGKPADPAARKAQVERGRYLTTVMGCNDCHTPGFFYGAPDMDRKLAGSEVPWKGPWGVTFARNLTPDMETGLGYWSEDEIVKAIRSGVKNDGSPILPPMPWQDFSALTDADAHAIAAYLMSLPPISHKVPDTVPPGKAYDAPAVEFPPPSAWDAPKGPAGK